MSTGEKWGLIWLTIATLFLWQEILTQEEGGRIVFWPEEDAFLSKLEKGAKFWSMAEGKAKF